MSAEQPLVKKNHLPPPFAPRTKGLCGSRRILMWLRFTFSPIGGSEAPFPGVFSREGDSTPPFSGWPLTALLAPSFGGIEERGPCLSRNTSHRGPITFGQSSGPPFSWHQFGRFENHGRLVAFPRPQQWGSEGGRRLD